MSNLELVGLSKNYPGFTLGPVTLTLPSGRAFGLLGPNGAGKTTLLGSVSAQLHHQGEARWQGAAITVSNWRLRESIAYVPEAPNLYDELTVAQTLRFGEAVFKRWDRELAREWQGRFQLESSQRVEELSKGMRTKLALLVGISHRAELLLLDEPTSGLDPESRSELQLHLKSLVADYGVCLVVSSHLFEDIELAADEVLVLRDGQIRFHSSIEQVNQMRVYTVERRWADGLGESDGVLVAKRMPDAAEIVVLDPGRLPWELRGLLEKAASRPASLREVYFALGRRPGDWRGL
ncbi:MAG: ABC transporter ATP-binding protein [Bryobacteraceae bacterium]